MMIQRCHNPKSSGYEYYGGRGIKVCSRWRKFENFFADMGERPLKTSIDRIDKNRDYEPSNCRWSTQREQNKNRRKYGVLEKFSSDELVEELQRRGVLVSTLSPPNLSG